jgi:hypothetical protein
MAIYDIDLLRALFVDKLNDNTIFLASFYEQIQDDQQIERYVETIKELLALQNREKSESNYKAMGIIAQSGNAEIINIKQNYISPLEYQARFDIELSDRDYVLGKLKTLINDLRGRKFDIVQLTTGVTKVILPNDINTTTNRLTRREGVNAVPNFMTPSVGYNPTSATTDWLNDILLNFNAFANVGAVTPFWFIYQGKLYQRNITYTTSPSTFTYGSATEVGGVDKGIVDSMYKLSLSFDGIQSQEPYINNGVDRVFLFFGGSATVVEANVSLGNDIVLNTIQVGKNTGTIYTVEPTEIPASLSVSDDTFQTYANGYRTQDRNLAIGNKMAYSFIYDNTIALYNDLYTYSRFGTNASTYAQQVFTIKEYRYAFGVLTTNTFYAKLGDVATSNTNGDVMTLSVNLKIGDY